MSTHDNVQPGQAGEHQPWREERQQPEPEAIEGLHAGRRVPEGKQRHPADDTQVGAASHPDGDAGEAVSDEAASGLAGGTAFSDGGSSQGTTSRGPAGPGVTHARGAGRDTEGAFSEQRP